MTKLIIIAALIVLYMCSTDSLNECQLTRSFDTCFMALNR